MVGSKYAFTLSFYDVGAFFIIFSFGSSPRDACLVLQFLLSLNLICPNQFLAIIFSTDHLFSPSHSINFVRLTNDLIIEIFQIVKMNFLAFLNKRTVY